MLDENILFITLVITFLIFVIKKQPELIAILILVYLAYRLYRARFTNPREFINWFQRLITDGKEIDSFLGNSNPCTNDNQVYCGNDTSADITFMPSFMRGMMTSPNLKNYSSRINSKVEDFQIDKRMKMRLGTKDITIEEIIKEIPVLLDYKIYLEKIIQFTLGIKTDDPIQRNFLARKLQVKMTYIFYNAYNTVKEQIYPMQSYNDLLLAEREFDDTINIFIFLGLDEITNNTINELQKEFQELNKKLNMFISAKVNEIAPGDYTIYYNKIPETYEPLPYSLHS